MNAPLVIARDVRLAPGATASLGEDAVAFPLAGIRHLPAGTYAVQALFDSNVEQRSVNAPGNLYSAVATVPLDPARCATTPLRLTDAHPRRDPSRRCRSPPLVEIRSTLLSAFHGRPVFLHAGVILPRDYDREPARRYPLRIHIGGYGGALHKCPGVTGRRQPVPQDLDGRRHAAMIFVHLDGDGPYGDPYQVNSANNGPYGDAVTQELIPHVEQTFRALGSPRRASSTAARPEAGSPWRCRSSTPTSSTGPGRASPIRWTSAPFSLSTSTRTTTPT